MDDASEPAIELDGLSKLYDGGRGVRGISLSVRRGEVFGFIGPNGAGKSTTIRAMLGLARRSAGACRVLGVDLEREPARRRETLARVGYVPSDPGVYEGRTVGQMLGFLGALHPRDTAPRRAELCARLDLDASRRADELSLGNKKKLALVAAMQHRPDVLVLDEPSNGLDPLVQQTLFELVREERDRGATVFFSSHVLSEVERFCDRSAILRAGQLQRVLTAKDLRGAGHRRVRAVFSRSEGSRLLALLRVPLPDDRTLDAQTDAPLPSVLEALTEDVREGIVTDVTLARPSLEELVLQEYSR